MLRPQLQQLLLLRRGQPQHLRIIWDLICSADGIHALPFSTAFLKIVSAAGGALQHHGIKVRMTPAHHHIVLGTAAWTLRLPKADATRLLNKALRY